MPIPDVSTQTITANLTGLMNGLTQHGKCISQKLAHVKNSKFTIRSKYYIILYKRAFQNMI